MRAGFIGQQTRLLYQMQDALIEIQTAEIRLKYAETPYERWGYAVALERKQTAYLALLEQLTEPIAEGALTEKKQDHDHIYNNNHLEYHTCESDTAIGFDR